MAAVAISKSNWGLDYHFRIIFLIYTRVDWKYLHSFGSGSCLCLDTANLSGLGNNAVLKNQVNGNSPSTKPMGGVSELEMPSELVADLAICQHLELANSHYTQESPQTLTFPVLELSERARSDSRKMAYLTGMLLMFSCRKQSHTVTTVSNVIPLLTIYLLSSLFKQGLWN